MVELSREFYFDNIVGGKYDGFPAGFHIHTKRSANPPRNRDVRLEECSMGHEKIREFNGYTPIIGTSYYTHDDFIRGDGWAYNFPKYTDVDSANYQREKDFAGVSNLDDAFRLLRMEVMSEDGKVGEPYFIYPAGREFLQELKRLRLE